MTTRDGLLKAAMPNRAEWNAALSLLREGATGLGRVLIQTSDMPATYDWMKRCRQFVKHAEAKRRKHG